jgi:hypothetical protein
LLVAEAVLDSTAAEAAVVEQVDLEHLLVLLVRTLLLNHQFLQIYLLTIL